ncbi:MAG: efflux RND transporter permease subunit [Nostoc sp. ZfuVER08]|uniref:Efflux RND transporter permease subunit n=1 Tax=Nostoc punctiforme FACHB-252 TaxID=1357509 RepID=A0ABR8H5P3_NOSPU|nr:efflux RND transporter permease subunit [Nostoc punctiforme]MBD2610566.1 efflux RND transporter permease subunit [Nostoc punctiforme FACHB-252]MBL1201510.1 efflux RND transporter permease subunit [Nostoc sp. GBBB01]MDZ8011764.1 efflux RND transporter permease subunit [Nostoc sp. ZfuVER08]
MQQANNNGNSGFSLSTIAIRQHIGTLMLTVAVIVIGIFFLTTIQVDLLPAITYPRIGVRLEAPGISPEVAVDEITRPLEEALSATENVVQVFSRTREGQVNLDLYFQPGGDIDQALNDATAAFNRGRSQLPDTIEEPRLFKVDPSQLPIYELALTSASLPGKDLRVFADEELTRELSVVPGVASIDVSGGAEEEVRVLVDLNRLQALGVGLNNLLDELTARNQDTSGGRILGQNSEPLTRTIGRFQSASEIENLSLRVASSSSTTTTTTAAPPRRVYLRDFAQVIDDTEEQRVFVYLNRQPAVKFSVRKQPEANTITVVEAVKRRIEQLRQSGLIPADMTLIPTTDESVFIRNSLNDVIFSGISGALLAAAAVLLFLGSFRQTLIISLTIPLCTLAAIALMKLFGLTLNVFSLAGLTLGVGQAIDTSVVILENISEKVGMTPNQREMEAEGKRRNSKFFVDTAIDASQEVESALVAATGANLVSVVPFLLIGGFIALLFNELILTISFAVAASLVVAITVVPMLSSRLLGISWSSRISEFWLLRQFNHRFEDATRGYSNFLTRVLRYRLLVVIVAFLILGGSSFLMFGQIPQEILPRISTGQASLRAQFPAGTPLATSQKVMQIVDEILLKQPETESTFTTVGGNLFGSNTTENPLRASSTINLKPGADVEAFVKKVTQEFNQLNLAGILLRLSPGQVRGLILNNSPAQGSDLDVILQGENEESLIQAGAQVLEALQERAQLATFRPDADPRQPEIQIRPDWERVATLGLSAQEIGATVQTAIEGSVPTQIQRGNRLVDVRVQLNKEAIGRPSQIEQLPLFTENNQLVRLFDVATIQEGQAPGEVQRINQRQAFIVAGNLSEGASLGEAIAEVNEILQDVDLPDGVSIVPSSAQETNQQLQDALKTLGALATFLIFVVMAVQYNSLIDPLVIMFTVPLALAGGIFGLYITQTPIGATVIVGVVLLVGIVVNAGILMVELANQIREEIGCTRQIAIAKAAPQRLRPIVMTTVTTILGLFPLALGIGEGSEFLQPLGIVVFFGMAIATMLTLFIIPCFYVLLHDLLGGKWTKPVLIWLRGFKKKLISITDKD